MNGATTLYRLRGARQALLYVGIAGNPGRRFEQHRSDKPWWGDVRAIELQHYPTREQAAKAEIAAIQAEHPRHNIKGNTGGPGTIPSDVSWRYGAVPRNDGWRYASLRSGHEWTNGLAYYWEVAGDPISDDWLPDEIDAYDLWRRWKKRYVSETGQARIYWFVYSIPSSTFEAAPFQEPHPDGYPGEDFLSHFTWPHRNGERLNWASLPVADKRWTPDCGDKGGFIQEVTGWKPSPLQAHMPVAQLAQAARL